MAEEPELTALSRRLSVLEQDVEGERTVSRLMLRKLNDVEDTLIGLTKAVADLAKAVGRVESQAVLSQAERTRAPKISFGALRWRSIRS